MGPKAIPAKMNRVTCSVQRAGGQPCMKLAVAPPVDHKIRLGRCWTHISPDECALYKDEITKIVANNPDTACPICTDNLALISADKLIKMSCCNQFFCVKCIDNPTVNKCPTCRTPLSATEPTNWNRYKQQIQQVTQSPDEITLTLETEFEQWVQRCRERLLKPQIEAVQNIVALYETRKTVDVVKFKDVGDAINREISKAHKTLTGLQNAEYRAPHIAIPTFEPSKRKAEGQPVGQKKARTDS
jgi:hypothetical protein